jgi:mannose-6-phosphate isomerase-like protein (cupin superfamily)
LVNIRWSPLREFAAMPTWFVSGPFPAEFHTDERCFITEQLNLSESPEASLALARVAPGVTTRLHAVHDTVERYLILKGTGLVEVGGETARVAVGDRVIIPAGVPQRITKPATPTWNSTASARRGFARGLT